MPLPQGDVTALFLGPPGSGKSALIAALCGKNVDTVEIPDGRQDSGVPSLRAAAPGLFLGELSCPPAAPGPWAAEANLLVLVLPGSEGSEEPLTPALGEAARAALARGTPLLAVRNLRPGDSQNAAKARDETAALLNSAGLGAAPLFVPPADCSSSDRCEELERLQVVLRTQAEALQRLLPPAQDGFEVLGAAELEAVREAFETGGLEAALSWVRAGLERLGSARLDLAVAGTTNVGLVLDMLLGLDPGDPGAAPASAPTGPTPYPAPERPNVVLWTVPLGPTATSPAVTPHPTHYDALILVTPGAPTEENWAQVRSLVSPDAPLVGVRTDGQGEDPPEVLEEEKAQNASDGNSGDARSEGKKAGIGDSGCTAARSPEDELWEVLEEAPPPVFPMRPGGLPGLGTWLQHALPTAQAGALLLALPPASPRAARRKAAALRAGAWRPALLASLAAAAAPVPGLGWACDVALLRGQLAEWRRALGLEPAAVARRERALGLAPGVLATRTRFPGPVTRAEVEARLGSWAELGTLRCRHCLSTGSCVSASELVCPAGSTHCYSGVLSLRGGGVISDLKVQGCISQSQPGCNLLNGTQTIGPVDVREDCGLQLDALKCQHGTLKTIQDISKLPLQWTAGQKICNVGEGCQDTLMLIENGEQVNLVLTKGCTTAKDQEAKVTEHRTGPGLSVTSYTRVCRKKDFCNDLSTTAPLWAPPPVTAPGTTRCPLCFSEQACENAPEQVCPAGSTHCYSGVLSLRGGGIISDLKVQGCMSQPGCNLLNGTQTIGPVDVSERCSPPSETTELSCYRGVMFELGNGFAEEPVKWTAPGSQVCAPDEICQETLLLIDVGQKSAFLGSKGCSSPGAQDNIGVSIFSRLPGMLVASYTKFCSSHLCNGADSSSVLLSILPRPDVPPPGDVQCPMCVELFGSCKSTDSVTCPRGATHCYKGDIALQGGGLTTRVSIQGCMAPPIKPLLGDSKTIGIFSAEESSNYRHEDDVTSAPSLAWTLRLSAWMLGLSALLSSLYAGICPLC